MPGCSSSPHGKANADFMAGLFPSWGYDVVVTVIYSNPREDGYFQGDVYPVGGYRSAHGAQRGSVANMPTYPGDPLTPFVAATKDAPRPPFTEAETLTKIPVLPISYADALPLLRALAGPVAVARGLGRIIRVPSTRAT